MEINNLKIILLVLCFLSIVPIIMFFKRKKTKTNIETILELYKNKIELNIEKINQGNKTIDEIEKKILICKRKLNMKIFDKK